MREPSADMTLRERAEWAYLNDPLANALMRCLASNAGFSVAPSMVFGVLGNEYVLALLEIGRAKAASRLADMQGEVQAVTLDFLMTAEKKSAQAGEGSK